MQTGLLKGKRGAHCKVYGNPAMNCAKTAEPIEMPFGMWTWVGPRKHVLYKSAHWRNVANTIEPSMCGGNAAFLSNYLTVVVYSQIPLH